MTRGPTPGASTRRGRLVYWTSTGLVVLVMSFSVVNFVFNDRFPFPNGPESAFAHLGLPTWFKVELTTAKILGLLALLVPRVPRKLKELAYFGFGVTLVSAAIAHASVGDARNLSVLYVLDPLFFLGALIVSYVSWGRLAGATTATTAPQAANDARPWPSRTLLGPDAEPTSSRT